MTVTRPSRKTLGLVFYIPFRYSALNCSPSFHIHMNAFEKHIRRAYFP